jgi:hypothetical protein
LKAFNFGEFAIKSNQTLLIAGKSVNVFVQYKGLQNKFYLNYKLFERIIYLMLIQQFVH